MRGNDDERMRILSRDRRQFGAKKDLRGGEHRRFPIFSRAQEISFKGDERIPEVSNGGEITWKNLRDSDFGEVRGAIFCEIFSPSDWVVK